MIDLAQQTQAHLEPGNCWQTSIASLLAVPAEALPPQIEYDRYKYRDDGTIEHLPGPSYMSVLQPYLRTHHGLAYVELHHPAELLARLSVREPGRHLMTGRTVRSATNGGQRHVVVGRNGVLDWDPHPSRAGLSHDINWAFLVSFPEAWKDNIHHKAPCVCPSCTSALSVSKEGRK